MLVPITLFRISDGAEQDWIGGTLYEALAKLCNEYDWRWHRVKEVGKNYITLEIMETWNALEDVCNLWEEDAYDVTYHWSPIIVHVPEVPAVADMRDAYEGAREDLLDWKRRALEAERKLEHVLNDTQGAVKFGEPVTSRVELIEPAGSKCDGCNGHGMLGNGHPDCSDVECHFCGGTGVDGGGTEGQRALLQSAPTGELK